MLAARRAPRPAPAPAGTSGTTARSRRGPHLAGEPHVGRRAHALEHAQLVGGRGGRCSSTRDTRTRHVEQRPRPPQTDACGIPAKPARLEDGEPGGHDHLAAARDSSIRTPCRRRRCSARPRARPARARWRRDPPEDRAGHPSQRRPLRRARKPGLADHGLHEAGLACPPVHFLARSGEAEQRQDRHEQEPAVERVREPRVPRPEPQPEVQPDAAVDPGDGEDDDLAEARDRIELPEARAPRACSSCASRPSRAPAGCPPRGTRGGAGRAAPG